MQRNLQLVFIALSLLLPHRAETQELEKIRLGFIGAFSGQAQVYGEVSKNGFELALDELGRDWIEVKYEDDAFLPSKSVTAFHKLASNRVLDAVVCVGSTPCNAVAPLAEKKRITLLAWASDPKVSMNRAHVLRTYPSGENEGLVTAVEAARAGLQKIAIFTAPNDYSRSWESGLIRGLGSQAKDLRFEVAKDATDFKASILRTKSVADSFAICVNPGQVGTLAKQIRSLGFHYPIFGCEHLHDSSEIAAAQGALDQAWFVTIKVEDEFRKKYIKRFGFDSVISGAANHYDLAYLLRDASKIRGAESIVEKIISLGKRNGAVGGFEAKRIDGDTFLDIEMLVQKVTPHPPS